MDHFAELQTLMRDGWNVSLDTARSYYTVRFCYRTWQVLCGFLIDSRDCDSLPAFLAACKEQFEVMLQSGKFRSGVEMARARFGDDLL